MQKDTKKIIIIMIIGLIIVGLLVVTDVLGLGVDIPIKDTLTTTILTVVNIWADVADIDHLTVETINVTDTEYVNYIDMSNGYGINNTASGLCIGYQANCFT